MRQPLAAYVADDEPDTERRGHQGIQVTADPCLGRGGAVPDRRLEVPHGGGHRLEEGVLRGLGDRADLGQYLFTTPAQGTGQTAGQGHGGQRGQHDGQLPVRRTGVDPDGRAQPHGQRADAEHAPRPAGGGGQRGADGEQRQPAHPGAARQGEERDGRDDQNRYYGGEVPHGRPRRGTAHRSGAGRSAGQSSEERRADVQAAAAAGGRAGGFGLGACPRPRLASLLTAHKCLNVRFI